MYHKKKFSYNFMAHILIVFTMNVLCVFSFNKKVLFALLNNFYTGFKYRKKNKNDFPSFY